MDKLVSYSMNKINMPVDLLTRFNLSEVQLSHTTPAIQGWVTPSTCTYVRVHDLGMGYTHEAIVY